MTHSLLDIPETWFLGYCSVMDFRSGSNILAFCCHVRILYSVIRQKRNCEQTGRLGPPSEGYWSLSSTPWRTEERRVSARTRQLLPSEMELPYVDSQRKEWFLTFHYLSTRALKRAIFSQFSIFPSMINIQTPWEGHLLSKFHFPSCDRKQYCGPGNRTLSSKFYFSPVIIKTILGPWKCHFPAYHMPWFTLGSISLPSPMDLSYHHCPYNWASSSLQPYRQRQHAPSKCHYLPTRLYNVTIYKHTTWKPINI